jgi:hypothetical protein
VGEEDVRRDGALRQVEPARQLLTALAGEVEGQGAHFQA